MVHLRVMDEADGLQTRRVGVNILNKQLQIDTKWSSSCLGFEWGANKLLTIKNQNDKKCYKGHWIWADSLEQPKQWKMGETWKVWLLYRLGSLMTSARELSKYRLHLIEYRSDGGWTSRNYTFFRGKGKKYNQLQTVFTYTTIISAIMTVKFSSDRMSWG